MTRKHFERAAEIIRSINSGNWGDTLPRVRAIEAAEFFIFFAREFNPRFDTQRFLIACGLQEKE